MLALAHEMTPTPPVPTGPFFHEDAPPVGLVELSTLPAWSPATHRVADGHEIAQMRMFASTSLRLHAAVPPAGSLEVRIPPLPSDATHAVLEAQETPHRGLVPSTSARVHAPAPPSGRST